MANNLINALSVRMKYLAERQTVITQNVANADTPGYKARDLDDFSNILNNTTQSGALTTTHRNHISSSNINGNSNFNIVQQDYSSDTTPTGNNVVIEEQMLKMNDTAHDYRATTSLYRKIHSLMKTSIGANQ